jgi:hypothetical protein
MDDTFKIFVYRLKDGKSEKIEESLSPDFWRSMRLSSLSALLWFMLE